MRAIASRLRRPAVSLVLLFLLLASAVGAAPREDRRGRDFIGKFKRFAVTVLSALGSPPGQP